MQRIRDLWETDRGRLVHYGVAAVLAVFLVVEFATLDQGPRGLYVALAIVAGVALLFTRDYPFAAPLITAGAIAGCLFADPEQFRDAAAPFFIVVLFMPWCVGVYNEPRRAVVGLVALESIGLWANVRFGQGPADFIFVGLFIAVAWTIGFVLNRRAEDARELRERAERLEREQVEAAERAVVEERQRIARELHDVIAHSVSVMTVQAGAVRRLLAPEQENERQALETVEATGRDALTEMRRLVGLLRDQGAMPEFSPQPGLGSIDVLLDGVRSAGLPVELAVDGDPRELPPE